MFTGCKNQTIKGKARDAELPLVAKRVDVTPSSSTIRKDKFLAERSRLDSKLTVNIFILTVIKIKNVCSSLYVVSILKTGKG